MDMVLGEAGDLGPITVALGEGMAITPASRLVMTTIARERDRLRGTVIDWGTGSGALAIAVARIPRVTRVVGVELDQTAVAVARENIVDNGVAERVVVLRADGFAATDDAGASILAEIEGRTDALVANPPGSHGDDGLGLRRKVLREALDYLVSGAPVLLQVSHQYGLDRITGLAADVPEYGYEGRIATTGWAEWDMSRLDLSRHLEDFARIEAEGGAPYAFADGDARPLDATAALERHRNRGLPPMTQWEVHAFRRL